MIDLPGIGCGLGRENRLQRRRSSSENCDRSVFGQSNHPRFATVEGEAVWTSSLNGNRRAVEPLASFSSIPKPRLIEGRLTCSRLVEQNDASALGDRVHRCLDQGIAPNRPQARRPAPSLLPPALRRTTVAAASSG